MSKAKTDYKQVKDPMDTFLSKTQELITKLPTEPAALFVRFTAIKTALNSYAEPSATVSEKLRKRPALPRSLSTSAAARIETNKAFIDTQARKTTLERLKRDALTGLFNATNAFQTGVISGLLTPAQYDETLAQYDANKEQYYTILDDLNEDQRSTISQSKTTIETLVKNKNIRDSYNSVQTARQQFLDTLNQSPIPESYLQAEIAAYQEARNDAPYHSAELTFTDESPLTDHDEEQLGLIDRLIDARIRYLTALKEAVGARNALIKTLKNDALNLFEKAKLLTEPQKTLDAEKSDDRIEVAILEEHCKDLNATIHELMVPLQEKINAEQQRRLDTLKPALASLETLQQHIEQLDRVRKEIKKQTPGISRQSALSQSRTSRDEAQKLHDSLVKLCEEYKSGQITTLGDLFQRIGAVRNSVSASKLETTFVDNFVKDIGWRRIISMFTPARPSLKDDVDEVLRKLSSADAGSPK